MKNITLLPCILLLISYSCFMRGMESGIEYRLAKSGDHESILDLINTHACNDSDKIVIVPEKFRASYIEDAIDAGRFFVAAQNKTIVGYKKLFCITGQKECDDTLNDELRCTEEALAGCSLVSVSDLNAQELLPQEVTKLRSLPITYIYNGADFTHPDYRGKRINTKLTQYAFNAIANVVLENYRNQNATHIALIYGLTRMNAGKESDLLDGRTQGILKQFVPFIKEITSRLDLNQPSHLIVSRYHAFKPSFDPKATECKPLSDDQAIPGYGYLVACALDKKSNATGNDL